MFRLFLLVFAVTVDGFAAAVTMGGSGIRIPVRSAVVLASVGTAFLGVSVFFSERIGSLFDPLFFSLISAVLLTLLGLYNITKAHLRNLFEARLRGNSVIFLDERGSDTDHNKIISVKESIALSVVLSADSLATGAASAAITDGHLAATLVCTFITGLLLVIIGNKLGKSIALVTKIDFEKICGVVLIVLAAVNLF
jgi:putative sporulation protein YtaF